MKLIWRSITVVFCLLTASTGFAGALDAWHTRASGTTNGLNAAGYANNLFVIVGSGATILTSPDGTSWTAQPLGITAPTFRAVSYGAGRYVAGGGEGVLIRSSTDGVHWTNGVSTIGAENVNGIAYAYGVFVAVGRGEQVNTGYILVSSNGLDWVSRPCPTTNTLFAVAPAIMVDGTGWATTLFVAVGDKGTILTSPDGLSWAVVNSGTTTPLRALAFHAAKFFAAGDHGTILYSSNGSVWNAGAPLSLDVRGLASSGPYLVAVGNYLTEGRLHYSTDGLAWPGDSLHFAKALNSVGWGGETFVAAGNEGLILQSAGSTTNTVISWTKPSSGNWQEMEWSLPRLPGPDLAGVMITNTGWKAVEINNETTTSYSNSVLGRLLYLQAPQDSYNVLLLNYAGQDRPLSIDRDFVLGLNSSLVSFDSGVHAGSMYISSSANLTDSTLGASTNIVLAPSAPAELNLTNCAVGADKLVVSLSYPSKVNHFAGVSDFSRVIQFAGGEFDLGAGWVSVDSLDVQSMGDFALQYGWQTRSGVARFRQIFGSMQASVMRLGMQHGVVPNATGEYLLESGELRCPLLEMVNGSFNQSGGTNFGGTLMVPYLEDSQAQYSLSGGLLIATNLSLGMIQGLFIDGLGSFVQSGGVHSNGTIQIWGDVRKQSPHRLGDYRLSGGNLVCTQTYAYGGGTFLQSGGTNRTRDLVLDCAGAFDLSGGRLITYDTTESACFGMYTYFTNRGGVHEVANRLLVGDCTRYILDGGTLIASFIQVMPSAELRVQSGSVVNGGALILQTATARFSGVHQFAKLQIVGSPASWCGGVQANNSVMIFGGSGAPARVAFLDSRDISWSGNLEIFNYNPTNSAGPDRLFIGDSAQGVNGAQLGRILFVNPFGWAPGPYGARITETGEILPAPPGTLGFNLEPGKIALFWQGGYQLTAATNVVGPYIVLPEATSPYTNNFAGPQRYFRLKQP